MPFVFPTNKRLQEIGPAKVARASANRRGFQLMPIRGVNEAIVRWRQKDNYAGLQQLRGVDGSPPAVSLVGEKVYQYNPGIFGEFYPIGETELLLRAGSIATDAQVNVDDLVTDAQDFLIQRELDRIEATIWTLLSSGTFSITAPNGNQLFTDTFAIQTYNRIAAWSDPANSRPLADFRAVQQLGPSNGANFGAPAVALMNRATANSLLGNANTADLFGKRLNGGNSVLNLGDANRIMLGEDLPQVEVYDEGYFSQGTTFVRYIPNNRVVVVGARPAGQVIGEYLQTRNVLNNGAPGPYEFVIDRINGVNGEKRVPPGIEVHRGHNGGPVIYYPGSVVVMTV